MFRFFAHLRYRIGFVFLVVLGSYSFLRADDKSPNSLRELSTIEREWERANNDYNKLLSSAKSRVEKEKISHSKAPNPAPFAERCLKLAGQHPGTLAELSALWWCVCHAPDAEAGQKAYDKLAKGGVASADLGNLAQAFQHSYEATKSRSPGLAPIVLTRVKQHPEHPKAASLLNWVCSAYFHDLTDLKDPPQAFAEAADLIVARYADSPDITNFCECLGIGHGCPSWAGSYEKHLRTILIKNQDRRVRGGASFALASVVHFTGGEARQEEAEKLYQQYLNEYDGTDPMNGAVEKHLRNAATKACKELRWRAVGKQVPEIEGTDLDGRPLKLSDQRGKVVLITFWATWCFPCMQLVPHEVALVERLRDKPFVLLGVNCDTDEEAVKDALLKHKINWRSFRNKRGQLSSISSAWDVIGFPTLYLIDDHGIIRKRWIGAPPQEELDRALNELLEKAARKGE